MSTERNAYGSLDRILALIGFLVWAIILVFLIQVIVAIFLLSLPFFFWSLYSKWMRT
jgi:hypothetical protein